VGFGPVRATPGGPGEERTRLCPAMRTAWHRCPPRILVDRLAPGTVGGWGRPATLGLRETSHLAGCRSTGGAGGVTLPRRTTRPGSQESR
jgi:hypothetical protein